MGGATPDNTNTNTGPKLGVGGWLMKEFHAANDFIGQELTKGANAIASFVTTNSGLTGQASTALKTNTDRINAAIEGNDLPETQPAAPAAKPPKP